MQHRMKEFTMNQEGIEKLLQEEQVGVLSTTGEDGCPYGVPVHFVWCDDSIWIHGLRAGEKLDNLRRDPRVCFTVWHMNRLLKENLDVICSIDTSYESAVIRGRAEVIDCDGTKEKILDAFRQKYAPELGALEMPAARVQGTAVIRICVDAVTGKYH